MHRKLSAVSLVTGFALALACGSGPADLASLKRGYAPGLPVHDPMVGHGEHVVPPDEARMGLTVQVGDVSLEKAGERARAELDALVEAVGEVETCAVVARGYDPPAWSDGLDLWVAVVSVDGVVDLRGASDVPTRMQRLDACRNVLLGRAAEEAPQGSHRKLALGAPQLVVERPERELPVLLARRAEQLGQLASAPGGLHPEDLRCVPKGVVVGERSLSGVVLRLDQECRVEKVAATEG